MKFANLLIVRIAIFVFLLFALGQTTSAQEAVFVPVEAGKQDLFNRAQCLNFAGTSTQTLLPGTQSNNVNYLYPGDSMSIIHAQNQIINDPVPATQAGISYIFYQCEPTASGPLLAGIVSDPCNYPAAPGQGVYLAANASVLGNAFFSNEGMAGIIGNANINYEGVGSPVEVWFAPVTMDAHITSGNLITESLGDTTECVHVNVADAFAVTYLNSVEIVDDGTAGLQGNITINGGLSEYDGTFYTVTIVNDADPLITGTITLGTPEHGNALTYTVPVAGTYTITATESIGGIDVLSVTFALPLSSSAFLNASILCFGDSTASVGLTSAGGIAPYTFVGTNAAGDTIATGNITANGDTVYINNLPAGDYTFVVTDNLGNTTTSSTNVFQPQFLAVNAPATNSTCAGQNNGSITASVTGGTPGYTYLWNTGSTNQTITNAAPGNYSVTVTDANGCTNDATGSIGEPNPLSLSNPLVIVNASCSGSEDGSIEVPGINGGTAPFNYEWNTTPVQDSQTAVNLNPGSYTVLVTDDNGCTISFSGTVSTSVIISISATTDNPSCFGGSDGEIVVTASGSTNLPYSFDWSANANTGNSATAANLPAGTYEVTVYDNTGVCNAPATFTLSDPAELTGSVTSSSNPSCAGDADGSITVSASGGTTASGTYTYDWSNGGTTPTISGLTAGTYTVDVIDDNGCVLPLSATLSDPDPVSIDQITPTNVTCFSGSNGSIQVTVSGGTGGPYTYTWTPNLPNTANPTGLVAGTYSVVVSDANGCTDEASVDVTEPAEIVIDLSPVNPLCHNQLNGFISATATGGTGVITFSWSNGATGNSISNLPPGPYIVTATDASGCTATETVTLINPPAIVTSFTDVTPTTCFATQDGSATVNATGGNPPFTFAWDNSETGATAIQLSQGWHSVTVTDASGCTRIDSVLVPGPAPISPASPTVLNVTCFGASDGSIVVNPTGGTAPYSYNWINIPGETSNAVFDLPAGVYVLVITDVNGCISPTISITVSQPPVLAGTISNTPVNCFGASTGSVSVVPAGGTVPYFYQWNDPINQTTSTATGLAAGEYQVVVTDAMGCQDTLTTIITENDPVELFVDSVVMPTCFGFDDGYVILNTAMGGVGPYNYSLGGVFFQPFTEFFTLSAGTYVFAAQDSLGCIAEIEVTIGEPDPIVVNAGPDQTIMLGDSALIQVFTEPTDSLLSLSWNPPTNLSCIACPNPAASPLESTTYTITAVDSTGCIGSDQITIFIDRTRNVFIPNAFTPNGDGENDVFMVYGGMSVSQVVTMQIYDRWGSLVFARNNSLPNDPAAGWNGTQENRNLNTGVYVYYIEVEFLDGERIPYRGDVTLIR